MFKKRPPTNLRVRPALNQEDGDIVLATDFTETAQNPPRKVKRLGLEVTNLDRQEKDSDKVAPGGIFALDSDGRIVTTDGQKVFSRLEIDTDAAHDHRAVLERNFEIGKKILAGELEEGVYRGQGAYRPHMQMREGAISGAKISGLFGPLRGSQFARTTMRIDYNPEICKDYKETGYCGYGDTCKFLHDRSDYKAGWQIDKEWEAAQKKNQLKFLKRQNNKETEGSPSGSSSDDD